MSAIAVAIGRVLLGALFFVSGIQKLADLPGTASYIASSSTLSPSLALPTAIFELVAGALLALGLASRLISLLLAGFTALTILLFHAQISDPMQAQAAMKNLAIIGGLLAVFAYGQMRWHYDHIRTVRKGEIETHKAELRAREAELAQARAEGLAEGRATNGAGDRPFVTAPATPGGYVDTDGDGVPDTKRRAWWRY
ncbi:DoxX family protein [Croceibacterium sp. TMG7-5b_MA50]|uniref:DoxX family protein n=1 Tax=Croceibacterium sp. TMG7-5b_MA50 TaxID=3121290 RepID=UPI003221DA87